MGGAMEAAVWIISVCMAAFGPAVFWSSPGTYAAGAWSTFHGSWGVDGSRHGNRRGICAAGQTQAVHSDMGRRFDFRRVLGAVPHGDSYCDRGRGHNDVRRLFRGQPLPGVEQVVGPTKRGSNFSCLRT